MTAKKSTKAAAKKSPKQQPKKTADEKRKLSAATKTAQKKTSTRKAKGGAATAKNKGAKGQRVANKGKNGGAKKVAVKKSASKKPTKAEIKAKEKKLASKKKSKTQTSGRRGGGLNTIDPKAPAGDPKGMEFLGTFEEVLPKGWEKDEKKIKGGRPTKITKEVLSKLEIAFAQGALDEEACYLAKISVSCLQRFQTKHKEFREAKAVLKQRIKLICKNEMMKGVIGDGRLALDVLRNISNKEFNTRQQSQNFNAEYNLSEEEATNLDGVLDDLGL